MTGIKWLLAAMAFAALPAFAGVSVAVSIFGSPAQTFTSTGVGTPGTTRTITVTFNPSGQTAFAAQLQTLGFAGANAGDFAIVPGGTCVTGTTVLQPITSTTGQTCTVNVRYTPSTAGGESAFLTASCTPIGLIGGFTVTCNGIAGNLTGLAGSILGALSNTASVPTLSPALLGILAMLVFAMGAWLSLRGGNRSR